MTLPAESQVGRRAVGPASGASRGQMDGCPRQDPAYRPATERAPPRRGPLHSPRRVGSVRHNQGVSTTVDPHVAPSPGDRARGSRTSAGRTRDEVARRGATRDPRGRHAARGHDAHTAATTTSWRPGFLRRWEGLIGGLAVCTWPRRGPRRGPWPTRSPCAPPRACAATLPISVVSISASSLRGMRQAQAAAEHVRGGPAAPRSVPPPRRAPRGVAAARWRHGAAPAAFARTGGLQPGPRPCPRPTAALMVLQRGREAHTTRCPRRSGRCVARRGATRCQHCRLLVGAGRARPTPAAEPGARGSAAGRVRPRGQALRRARPSLARSESRRRSAPSPSATGARPSGC